MKNTRSVFSPEDIKYMDQALALARDAKGLTFPNPAVGAVIVKNGRVVGKGATSPAGGDHAEKQAIALAGKQAQGATLYVTLEPCHHFGKTPPCTTAILAAGIIKVIVAIQDPNPLVNGRGIRFLRRNHVSVSIGLLRERASAINEDFFWSITHQVPWVTVKVACTLDGKIADSSGMSKWITNKDARTCVHEIRRCHAAVAVGGNTLRQDNPHLNVRHVPGASPVRIVFSTTGSIPQESYFYKEARKIRSIVVRSGGASGTKTVGKNGIETWYMGTRSNHERMMCFLRMAYTEGITSILVEGGQGLAASFFECGCVNRLYIFYGNKIIGKGLDGLAFSKGLALNNAIQLSESRVDCFGDTVMITGKPEWK